MSQTYKSDFLNILNERGFIHQCSDFEGLDALAAEQKLIAYVGYDCTAKSLHIGNLLSIMMLHWLQKSGNRPITLMGGGTTMVGDPSGKDETRAMRTVEEIGENKASIKTVFEKLLTFGNEPNDAIMVDNADWLLKLGYIEMLREVGRHFSVNRMLSMDSVKLRLEREQEMSFIEFNYMVCQSYDYVQLAKNYGVNLQMGGSDQWGNIVTGLDLGRRMGTHQLYALTTPLLTTSSGAKMGKTAQGAVWLNGDQFSPYDYWQFWRNTEDGDVVRFLKLFTTLPMDEIAKLSALDGAEINQAKIVLATEATALIHGRVEADKAAQTAQNTFEKGFIDANLPTISAEIDTNDVANLEASKFLKARSAKAIAFASKLFSSKSDVRRKMADGAIRINGEKISDPDQMFSYSQVEPETGAFRVQFGKKHTVLVKPIF